MKLFPVEYSTLSATALLSLVQQQYDIAAASILFLKRGFNDTYLITAATQKFILRVYKHNWRQPADINCEMELLNYLFEKGVSVAAPVKDKEGKLIQSLLASEGIRYAALFTYVNGEPIKKINNDQAYTIGKSCAQLHALTCNLELSSTARDYDIEKQWSKCMQVLSPVLEAYPQTVHFLETLKNRFYTKIEAIDKNDLKYGICHGDMHAENFYLNCNNKVIFFDFDFFGKGYLVYDIGVFMWYDHKNKPPAIQQSFLKGYENILPLSKSEIALIPWMSTLRAVFQMTMYCELHNGIQLPLWPPHQIALFVGKIEKWWKERVH